MTSVVLSTASVILVVMAMQEIADQGPSIPIPWRRRRPRARAWFVRPAEKRGQPLAGPGPVRHPHPADHLDGIRAGRTLAFMAVDLVLVQYLQNRRRGAYRAARTDVRSPGIAAIVGTVVTPILAKGSHRHT